VLIPDQIEDWLIKVLPSSKDTSSFKRKDTPDFPIEVLREAIVNALVHRDYEVEGAKCEIKIDENKIIVTSPGKPLPAISLEQLNTFEAPSLSRNPIITYVFSLMDYVEEKGFGMKTFKSLNKQYGLPIPKFSYRDPFLTLTFTRNIMGLKSFLNIDLSDEELKYFEIFWEQRGKFITKSEFVDYSKLSTRTAERYLSKWTKDSILVKHGSGPSTKYQLND
jgi:ATP-dependent DNA helicase RecG